MSKKIPYTIQKRMRYDKLLIFVAIFGIIGSVVVFRSYANTRVSSAISGTYSVDKFTLADTPSDLITIKNNRYLNLHPEESATIELATARGKQYCISGYNRAGASVKLTMDDKTITNLNRTDLPIVNSNQPILLGCIEAKNNNSDNQMIVEITGSSVWVKDIIVN